MLASASATSPPPINDAVDEESITTFALALAPRVTVSDCDD
jgi:hypothetical protein